MLPNVRTWGRFTVQDGEVVFVFVYHQRIQPIAALPELSSAELPAKDDETVSNIFEKIDR